MGKKSKKKKEEALNFFGALRFVNQFLDKMHLQLVLFYLGWLFDTVVGVLSPVLFGVMINQMVYYRNLPLFIRVGLAFFGLSVFSCVQYFLLYDMNVVCIQWSRKWMRARWQIQIMGIRRS